MKLLVIADARWGIGRDGEQQLYIPADLKRFQAMTTGGTIILGRKTLSTFPGGRPLKHRRNLILSANPAFAAEGAEVFANLETLLAAAPEDSFVIGGESVYRQLLPHCDTAYVTRLCATLPADRYFPDLDAEGAGWRQTEAEGPQEYEGILYYYVTYRRSEPV